MATGSWDSLVSLCPAHMDLSIWKTASGATFSFSRSTRILGGGGHKSCGQWDLLNPAVGQAGSLAKIGSGGGQGWILGLLGVSGLGPGVKGWVQGVSDLGPGGGKG